MTKKDEINVRNNSALRKIPGKFILSFAGKRKKRSPQVMRWVGWKCDCCGMSPNYIPDNIVLAAS